MNHTSLANSRHKTPQQAQNITKVKNHHNIGYTMTSFKLARLSQPTALKIPELST